MRAARTRNAILDVAEALFAERGFHGVSIREIAEAAGMRQSLVHYHFSNKETLYAAVYGRRAGVINERRSAALRALQRDAAAPVLADVVEAFMAPGVLSSRDRAGGAIYGRLITQIINDPQKHARRISRTYNDPMAKQTIEALRAALPSAEAAAITWGYMFAIGAMTTAIERTGRVRRLDPGCKPADTRQTLDLLVTFVTGGLQALASGRQRPRTSRRSRRIS